VGVNQYAIKPVSTEELLHMIQRALGDPTSGQTIAGHATVSNTANVQTTLPASATPRATQSNGSGVRLNILLAEDNPFNQKVAVGLLSRLGHTVEIAGNGLLAVEKFSSGDFDIVLMDVQMPEMDGYEATRKIRATSRLAGQKVIAMTANAMAEDRERCLASGMDDFISKPIDPDQIVLVLAKWLPDRAGITPEEGLVADLRSGKERRRGGDRRAAKVRMGDDVIDLAILGHLVSDDSDKVRKFALKFLETAQKTLAEMDAAHTSGDLAALGGLGHKLKSSARTVGAMGFADLCQALESADKANDLSQAGMLLRQLHPLLERIARQVEQETA